MLGDAAGCAVLDRLVPANPVHPVGLFGISLSVRPDKDGAADTPIAVAEVFRLAALLRNDIAILAWPGICIVLTDAQAADPQS